MRGVYTVDIKISALAAAKTLLLLQAPAGACVEIISAMVGSSGSNVTNQQLEAEWAKVTTLGSPTGTAITPSPQEHGDVAAGSTVTGNLTVEPTTYSAQIYDHQGFPSLGGYQHQPVPEERIVVSPSAAIGLKLISTPTSLDLVVRVVFREIGG
jgi:hypothetical protein